MFQFSWRKKREAIEEQVGNVVAGIVQSQFGTIKKEIGEIGDVLALKRKKSELEGQIEKLKLEHANFKEDQARQVRETEHKVGLVKKQHEQEIEFAKREVALEVKEQTLDADRKRFEEQMKFEREQLEGQIGHLRDIIDPLLRALPSAEIIASIGGGKTKDD
jgi:predicted RNase H-like nuclease (RuvC/YqgF family)